MRIGRDLRWFLVWCGGLGLLGVWDLTFLNRPAFMRIVTAFGNTLIVAALTCLFSLVLAWGGTLALTFTTQGARRMVYAGLTFVFNLIRSVPQILGILLGYTALALWVLDRRSVGPAPFLVLTALIIALFVFLEIVDLMRGRIDYFRKSDFYEAMQVCGIAESRIVNFDILWRCSRVHIFNKLLAVFAMAVFLQCSVDFVISVGLSTSIHQVNLPPTLGSMLARIDSKQDILAIGHTLTHPGYFPNLFLGHLQGISVAFLIVFTLVCFFNISNAFARRHHL